MLHGRFWYAMHLNCSCETRHEHVQSACPERRYPREAADRMHRDKRASDTDHNAPPRVGTRLLLPAAYSRYPLLIG